MRAFIYIFTTAILITLSSSCGSAEKAANERRNLMMPKQHELPRNHKYKAPKATKKYYKKTRS